MSIKIPFNEYKYKNCRFVLRTYVRKKINENNILFRLFVLFDFDRSFIFTGIALRAARLNIGTYDRFFSNLSDIKII